jgi:ABC-type phosphate transport system substrate-binding protein
MKTRRTLLLALLFTTAVASWPQDSAAVAEGAIVVIVNKANPVTTLAANELRPIFQTRKNNWSNGDDVVPLNLPEDNQLRREFDQAVLGLDAERVARYWKDRKIRGGARPPKHLPNTAAVLAAVAANSGAIGYVHASEANKSVKVVARIVGGKLSAP